MEAANINDPLRVELREGLIERDIASTVARRDALRYTPCDVRRRRRKKGAGEIAPPRGG